MDPLVPLSPFSAKCKLGLREQGDRCDTTSPRQERRSSLLKNTHFDEQATAHRRAKKEGQAKRKKFGITIRKSPKSGSKNPITIEAGGPANSRQTALRSS